MRSQCGLDMASLGSVGRNVHSHSHTQKDRQMASQETCSTVFIIQQGRLQLCQRSQWEFPSFLVTQRWEPAFKAM